MEDVRARFLTAVERGDAASVAALLADARVDPAADENLALRIAAVRGHVEVVHLLLADARVDPLADGCTAARSTLQGFNGSWMIATEHASTIERLLAEPGVVRRLSAGALALYADFAAAHGRHGALLQTLANTAWRRRRAAVMVRALMSPDWGEWEGLDAWGGADAYDGADA
jgi:hypothetical protein